MAPRLRCDGGIRLNIPSCFASVADVGFVEKSYILFDCAFQVIVQNSLYRH